MRTPGAPPPSEGLATGLSFSPPFVLCTSMSPSGLLAVGTADGRLWIGTGGEKTANRGTKKKRSRKWEGLRPEGAIEERIAEGPVVGVYATFVPYSFVWRLMFHPGLLLEMTTSARVPCWVLLRTSSSFAHPIHPRMAP